MKNSTEGLGTSEAKLTSGHVDFDAFVSADPMPSDAFDRSRLSNRENEILRFAADGLTDIQIALRLDIRPSTVNSYWVRIRGKLGHRSRTELVAMALRKQAKDENAELLLRSQKFERLAAERAELAEGAGRAAFLSRAIEALPDAVAFVEGNGVIRHANGRLSGLFGYGFDELCGMRAVSLIAAGDRKRIREIWSAFVSGTSAAEIGLTALRKDRTTFDACLRLAAHVTASGVVAACLVLPE
jgi:PAS domain S-box-containing protein